MTDEFDIAAYITEQHIALNEETITEARGRAGNWTELSKELDKWDTSRHDVEEAASELQQTVAGGRSPVDTWDKDLSAKGLTVVRNAISKQEDFLKKINQLKKEYDSWQRTL